MVQRSYDEIRQVARILEQYWVFPKFVDLRKANQRMLFIALMNDVACFMVTLGQQRNYWVGIAQSTNLPFSGSTFDLALVLDLSGKTNGEGISAIGGQISKVLKPDGILFLGSEGRWGYRYMKYWIESHGGNTYDFWRGCYRRRRDQWNEALESALCPIQNYYLYPSLLKPSIIFTTPELFLNVRQIDFLQTLCNWKRLVASSLVRIGLTGRLSSSFSCLTVWGKKTNGINNFHGASRSDRVCLDRSAALVSSIGMTNCKVRFPEHLQMIAYTRKAGKQEHLILTGAGKPFAFAKFSRQGEGKLIGEQHAVSKMRQLLRKTSLHKTLPAWSFQKDGMFVYEYRVGVSLGTLVRPRILEAMYYTRIRKFVRAATSWLVEFQQIALASSKPDYASEDGNPHLRRGPIHGDYTPNNIIISEDGEIVIIDWEYFEERQFVVYDFLKFITRLGIGYKPLRFDLAERCLELFFVRSRIALMIRDEINYYCASTGINPATLKRMYPYFIQQRLDIRAKDGLCNDGHYLVEVKRFFQDHYTTVSLFDVPYVAAVQVGSSWDRVVTSDEINTTPTYRL